MTSGKLLGECVFFDVGQGSANALLMPDNSAVVFDAGPRKQSDLHDFLDDRRVSSIECVILSHNDRDHIAGWEELAKRFAGRIKNVVMLVDRDMQDGDILDLTIFLASEGAIPYPTRAEVKTLSDPYRIYSSSTGEITVDLIYPDMRANVEAIKQGDPNLSSVIAVVRCKERVIVLPGDSVARAWRELSTSTDLLPLDADILAMPHHGGLIGDVEDVGELAWVFTEAICPGAVTVSAGSFNQHKHPRRNYIEWLRGKGIRIGCTQITKQCYDDNDGPLRTNGNVLKTISRYSASHPKQDAENCIACAGTMIAEMREEQISFQQSADHLRAIKSTVDAPMCIQKHRQ